MITKETGICTLTKNHCIGYIYAYNTMTTVLHLILTTNDYFKGFLFVLAYVRSATYNSDGFKVLYWIV